MRGFFQLLYRNRAFLTFFLLELCSFWLININNNYQGAIWFNTSNYYASKIIQVNKEINNYFNLRTINKKLAEENADLRRQLILRANKRDITTTYTTDSIMLNRYKFEVAKVINNSTHWANNFITINKGLKDGVLPNMGVISPEGVVGKVKNCSDHYSVITSVLHSNMQVSTKVKKYGALCTTKWDGINATKAELLYVPRHFKIKVGDTVVTSGYGSVYPEGIMVGRISSIEIRPDQTFYDADLKLSTDFSNLLYVYVVVNKLQTEQDSLEVKSEPIHK
jgi:rod shape-determining protein MreC